MTLPTITTSGGAKTAVWRYESGFDVNSGAYFQQVAPLSDGYFLAVDDSSSADGGVVIAYRLEVDANGDGVVSVVDTEPWFNTNMNFYSGIAQSAENHVVILFLRDGEDALWGYRFDPDTETLTGYENTGYSHPYQTFRNNAPYNWSVGRKWSEGVAVIGKGYEYNGGNTYYGMHWVQWGSGDAVPTLTDFHEQAGYYGAHVGDVNFDLVDGVAKVMLVGDSDYEMHTVDRSTGFSAPITRNFGFPAPSTRTFLRDSIHFARTDYSASPPVWRMIQQPADTENVLGTMGNPDYNFPSNPFYVNDSNLAALWTGTLDGRGIDVTPGSGHNKAIVGMDGTVYAEWNDSNTFLYGMQGWCQPITAAGLTWYSTGYDEYDDDSFLFVFITVPGAATKIPALRFQQTDAGSERLGGKQKSQARSQQSNPRRIGGRSKNSYY